MDPTSLNSAADQSVVAPPGVASTAAGNEPAFRLGHRRWLDGLRGVAVLLVVAYHLGQAPGGFLGVDVFFVLSGFLITTLLVEEWQRSGRISLPSFYARRALRLLPAFGVLLIVCAAWALASNSAPERWARLKGVVVAGCYLTNFEPWFPGTDMSLLGHTWSLALEEQFYLIWPLCLAFLLRRRLGPGGLVAVVSCGIVASACHRYWVNSWYPNDSPEKWANVMRMYVRLDTRADAVLSGCLVALLATGGWLPALRRHARWTGLAAVVSAAFLGYLVVHSAWGHCQYFRGLFTGIALMVGVILIRLLTGPQGLVSALLGSTAFVAIGRLSYALYLFHIPIIYWLRPYGIGPNAPANTVLVALLSLAAATASYWCVERPCLRLKRRFEAPTASAPPPAPQLDGNRQRPAA